MSKIFDQSEAKKIYRKQYYADNREAILSVNREYARKRRLDVLSHYSNGAMDCECCGESVLEFLTIDHIDGGGRKHRMKHNNIYYILKKDGYPAGYRVLCFNCNSAMGIYGICPHKKV